MSFRTSTTEIACRLPERGGGLRVPGATYRIQFNDRFTFSDASAVASYLCDLGITDLYASPLLKAAPGSSHGYDTCSANDISDALGGGEGFNALSEELRARGLRLLLDIVPNHMGACSANAWWWDVLKHGRNSSYARYFDIDWDAGKPGLAGKVLLPVLGKRLGEAVRADEIKLVKNEGEYRLAYYDKHFPIAPETPREWLERIESAQQSGTADLYAETLLAALDAQHYRLAHWRIGNEEINYRRFFDVGGLVAMRMEDAAVFDAAHAKIAALIEAGQVAGIRVDHPDGLRDPKQYFQRLQSLGDRSLYVVVEKILSGGETIPENWAVHGTTGYDFLNQVNGLFVARENEREFDACYEDFTGATESYEDLAYRCKKRILDLSFTADVDSLATRARELAEGALAGRDLTWRQLRAALVEIIACLPVYRTYVDEQTRALSSADQGTLRLTASQAIQRAPALRPALDFIVSILSLKEALPEPWTQPAREFILRFQQLSGPAAAKGIEDTAFYNYNRFISLNEVGGEPDRFGLSVDEFHAENQRRRASWPHSLLATATHDTKRGEDVRARLNVLSEMPDQWRAAVGRWREWNQQFKLRAGPDAADEYLLYQTLVGAFDEGAGLESFRNRMADYMLKAAREAKRNTSWLEPNEDYEAATRLFIETVLDPEQNRRFVPDLRMFATEVAYFGRFNSLAQTLLKMALPGVPDLYQGSELWDLSLVDPDNRRPVDFQLRARLLKSLRESPPSGRQCSELLSDTNGSAKLFLIWRVLQCRELNRALFDSGTYEALAIDSGTDLQRHLCAFARIHGQQVAIVVVPLFLRTLLGNRQIMPAGKVWADAEIVLPEAAPDVRFENAITGMEVSARSGRLRVAELLADFPAGLFIARP